MTKKTRIAIAYCRVSTKEQAADDRYSLRAQVDAIKEGCAAKGWTLAEDDIFVDAGISAKSGVKQRPALEAALQRACEVKGVVVVKAFTRLVRSAAHAETVIERLTKAGADVISLTDPIDTTTAMGRAMVGIISVFARLESEIIGERVAAANKQTVSEKGYRTQAAQAFGYVVKDGARVEREGESRAARVIVRLARRKLSTDRIAELLNNHGIKTVTQGRGYDRQTSGKWHRNSVRRIIKRLQPELIKSRRANTGNGPLPT